ncbi:hypothetical protein ACFE04_024123 [Oxalis oulophora]
MSIIDYNKNHDDKINIFEKWLIQHGKNYNALGEKEKRFEIFKDNLRFIEEHNSVDRSYKLGLNKFADLTNDEYRNIYLGTSIKRQQLLNKKKTTDRYLFKGGGDDDDLPQSVDWREKGAVVGVKDQGQCG